MNKIVAEDVDRILSAELPWRSFDGATILIAGAAGLLPAYMVHVLLAMKHHKGYGPRRVIGLVRTMDKARARFAHVADRPELLLVQGDVTQPQTVDGPIDFVIHAASPAHARHFKADPVGTITANVAGCQNLLELSRAKGASFFYFSSAAANGPPGPADLPLKEDAYFGFSPLNVLSSYAEAKRVGEMLCAGWNSQYGVPTRIVRPFHTYGPGMDLQGGWVYSDFVADILARRHLVIRSDGLMTRSFCYIADATLAYFTVLLRGEDATPYNVGTGIETSILKLAHILVDEFRDRNLEVVVMDPAAGKPRGAPPERSCPDISRLRALGWTIEPTSVRQGFRRTVESIEQG